METAWQLLLYLVVCNTTMGHNVEIAKISSQYLFAKITWNQRIKYLFTLHAVSRNIFPMRVNFSFFHTVYKTTLKVVEKESCFSNKIDQLFSRDKGCVFSYMATKCFLHFPKMIIITLLPQKLISALVLNNNFPSEARQHSKGFLAFFLAISKRTYVALKKTQKT